MQCGVCGADNNFCGACGATLVAERSADAPAGFWTRFAAFAIDIVLMVVIAQLFATLSTIITLTFGAWLDFIPYGRVLQSQQALILSSYYAALFAASMVYFTLGVSVCGRPSASGRRECTWSPKTAPPSAADAPSPARSSWRCPSSPAWG